MFGDDDDDDDAIKYFSRSKTKCSYLINFGLAPYFKDKFLLAIRALPFYSILFDESMNSVLQQVLQIRFWDSENSLVKRRYFDSQFMYRANQDNLY